MKHFSILRSVINKPTTSFSARLSLYIVLITTLIFALTFYIFFNYSRRTIKKEAVKSAESTLMATNLRINNVLHSVEVAIDNMSWMVAENISRPDSMYGVTRRLIQNNPIIVGSAIAFESHFFPEKGLFFSPYSYRVKDRIFSKQLGNAEYDYRNMDWFRQPKALKKGHWSEPYFDKGGADLIMTTYSQPLFDAEGRVYAIFTADISLEWLSGVVNGIKPYPSSYSFIIGCEGTYIVHPRTELILNANFFSATAEMTDTIVSHLGRDMLAGRSGMVTLQNNDTLSYVFYAPVPITQWSTAIVCPHCDIFADSDRSEQIILYVVLAGLLLLLLFCTQIIQRLSNPLKEFARSAHSIAGGNFHTALPVIKTHNEMWELCQSFDFMQTSLNGYIEELKEATSKKERIESELRIARDIQMGMIPKIFPPFPDRYEIDLFAVLQPAKEVGGDLYDFFIDGDKLFFAIGDVAGKGVPASLFMAVTRSLFRTVAAHLKTPLRIVESMNNSIVETSESNMFVTLFVGVLSLDSGRLSYCNAGHNPPLLITPEQEVAYMQVNPNIPVGLFYNFAYTEQEVCFAPDTTIVLYTDGLTEAENSAFELFSEARLLALLCADSKKSPKEITCHIVEEVHRYAGEAEQSDDLTLLTINYNPNKRRINDAEKLSHKE